MSRTDRAAGALLLALAAACAWLALDFRLTFPADPVGPRALPFFAAGLLVTGGAALLLRPRPEGAAAPDSESDPTGPTPLLRVAGAVAAFALYPALLPLLGFVAATGAAMGALGLLVGGPPLRSFAAAFALAGGLWLLFAWALGVPLPVGRLFLLPGG